MFKVFQPVIVRIERLSIFVVAGGATSGRGSTGSRPSASGRSQLQEYHRAFYRFILVVPMSHKNLEHRVIGNGCTMEKMMFKQYCLSPIIAGCVILWASCASCLPFESDITSGNRFYKKANFKQAEELYSKASSKKETASYNLGNALYKQGRFKDSERMFNSLTQSRNEKLKKKVHYNQGNSQFRQEDYNSAIKSYEMAVRLDQNDKDAKHNLALAKKMLQMQKNNRQNQQNKQQQQEKRKKNDQKQDSSKGKGMNREDAERLLQEIGADERHKGKRVEGKGMGNGLDW